MENIFIIVIIVIVVIIIWKKGHVENFLNLFNGNHITSRYLQRITYFIANSTVDSNFQQICGEILSNTSIRDKYPNLQQVYDVNNADILIELVDRQILLNYVDSPPSYYNNGERIYFSYTWQHPKPHIKIDSENWLKGVPASKLTLNEYRHYVIQHEFMHALGYDHQKCDNTTAVNNVCPILYQSTRGCPDGFKCGFNANASDFTKRLHNAYF